MAQEFSRTMIYPTADEFKEILKTTAPDNVTRQYIFQGTPYVFRDQPRLMNTMRDSLCPTLRLRPEDVVIIGSGRLGYSVAPAKFPRQFHNGSDIDVLVVNAKLYDTIWSGFLRWHYIAKGPGFGGRDRDWMSDRRRELVAGWVNPDALLYEALRFSRVLKPLRNTQVRWFNAFQSLSLIQDFASRHVSGRLYRTWDHALQYHPSGLRQLRNELFPEVV